MRTQSQRKFRAVRKSAQTASQSTLEMLETRRLMATVNVSDFGAKPNDGIDDSGAITAAINASRDGDTIHFGGGNYNVGSRITLKSNRVYSGGGTLTRPTGQDFIAKLDGASTNITVDNLTFNGGGIDAGTAMTRNVVIKQSTFQNITRGYPTGNAVFVPAGMENSKIINNKFINVNGETGVYGFNRFHNVDISGNHFDNVFEGIHLAYENGGDNLTIKNNTFLRTKRMAIEIQGRRATNTLIEGNKASEWRDTYDGSFFLSIVNMGYNTVIRNNHGASGKFGQIDPNAKNVPVGIEASGRGLIVENNVVESFREGLHLMNARDVVVKNNKFYNQTWMAIWRTGISTGEFNGENIKIENNELYNPMFTAFLYQGSSTGSIGNNKIYLFGGKEYDGGGYNNVARNANQIIRPGGVAQPYTGQSPSTGTGSGGVVVTPIPTGPSAPGTLVVTSKGVNRIDLVWGDNSGNETGFKIQRRDNSTTTWVDVATVGANVKTYSDTGIKADTNYSYRVLAVNASGVSGWSNEHNAVTDPMTVPAPTPIPTPVPPPPAVPAGKGTGLKGEYFDNRDLTNKKGERTDATVNFDWGLGSPMAGIEGDTFSVRWTGQIEAVYSEEYTFSTGSDDGVRLWINGQLVIDSWGDQPLTEKTGKIRLEAGKKYDIKLEYYENRVDAAVTLAWSSASQTKGAVPASRLYAPAAQQPSAKPHVGTGDGLTGEFFNNIDLTDRKLVNKGAVNYNWGLESPTSEIENDSFSARFTGQILAQYDETYTFYVTSDDGVRLWVDGKLVIDNWQGQSTATTTGKVLLQAGKKHDIKLEYFEHSVDANCTLGWSSTSQVFEIVPQSQLFSNAAVSSPTNPDAGKDLARGKKTTASGTQEGAPTWIDHLTDGDDTTRWASRLGQNQEWVRVDLGATYDISRVKLNWETAYARSYQIQVSNDGQSWKTLHSTTNGDGKIDDVTGLNGEGRYVRLNLTERGYPAGYSLWSMEVFA